MSKRYGTGPSEVHALEDIDLTVGDGELVAVMGPSGSGKSTLLTIAGSLEDPSSGEVYVDGRALSSLSRNRKAQLRRQSIGYVFQDYNLLAGLSAVENVSLPMELDGVAARKAQAAAVESLENSTDPAVETALNSLLANENYLENDSETGEELRELLRRRPRWNSLQSSSPS